MLLVPPIMASKMFNFPLTPAAAERLSAVRASTGLSHAVNLAWGMKQWVEAGATTEGVFFSPGSSARQQKVLKLPQEAAADLALLKLRTGLPLWRVADGALFFCTIKRHPDAIAVDRNPKLAEFTDEEIRIEATRRGFRVEKD